MFKKILIANRGEIAVRIIHAAKELGLSTVAVYSEADKDSLPVRLAEEAICIGPASPSESYLNIPAIMAAAEVTGAEAIHPGYGFLAENPGFAEVCQDCNLVFIGPPLEAMEMMGDKIAARKLAKKVGVPILPGTLEPVDQLTKAKKEAEKIGFPVMLKAAAGGGGRGMRIVHKKEDFETTFATASKEAEMAFGDGRIYIEKYLTAPRHVEIQILADQEGKVIHLGERECSIQRRHQKLIEEAPSPIMTKSLRKKMGESAVKLARACGYISAGTVEFLVDEGKNFYFMEMNTRIQVEHTITEEVTGIDLVKNQILIALGEPLPWEQKDIQWQGHAIEFRINAEDPKTFIPCPGKISQFIPPSGPGVRFDTHLFSGYTVPPHYDSLLGKLIIHGRDRKEALARAKRALHLMVLEGPKTSIPLYLDILEDAAFQKGRFSTHFMEQFLQ